METYLKILKSGRDKLVNIAEAVPAEMEDRSEDELVEVNEEILYNKGCLQNMAQMLLDSRESEVTRLAYAVLEETKKATNQSSNKIRGLRKKLDSMPTGSKAGNITG